MILWLISLRRWLKMRKILSLSERKIVRVLDYLQDIKNHLHEVDIYKFDLEIEIVQDELFGALENSMQEDSTYGGCWVKK